MSGAGTPGRAPLESAWAMLPSRPTGSTVATFDLSGNLTAAHARLGVDKVNGRHLLLPLDARAEHPHQTTIGAIEIKVTSLAFDGADSRWLDVSCRRRDLLDLFDEVIVDILDMLERGTPGPLAVESVLERWRALLVGGSKQLSTEVVTGLVGELLTLEGLLRAEHTVTLDIWRGPLGETHDFSLGGADVEVKGLGSSSGGLKINGVRQLEEPEGRRLFLFAVCLQQDPEGRTLQDIVDDVAHLSGQGGRLAGLLARVGYLSADAARYPTRFAVSECWLWRVTDGFPRIVPSTFEGGLPAALGQVRYHLAMEHLPAADTKDWDDAIARVISP